MKTNLKRKGHRNYRFWKTCNIVHTEQYSQSLECFRHVLVLFYSTLLLDRNEFPHKNGKGKILYVG